MANDWIPMRTNLEDDPTVIFISRATKLQPDHVVGKLHRLWSWVDSHTGDGDLAGIDAAWIDHYVKKKGFAHAMANAPAPWLEIDADGVLIPNFEHWFGASAKRRIMDTRRKQLSRSLSGDDADGLRTKTGLQQSREEKSILAPALGAAEWEEILGRARQATDKIGKCGTQRNRRVLLGACVLAANGLGDSWLETALRETKDAHPANVFAYLQAILIRTADSAGVDFRGSIAAIEFPDSVAKRPTSVSGAHST